MELDVLADGDVGKIARVFAGEAADGAKLVGGEDAVGNADAHHEVVGGKAFAALAAGGADAIALRVDSPPLEVERGPLRDDAGAAFAGEGAHFVEGFPRVLGKFEALGALGLRFFSVERRLDPFCPLLADKESPRQRGLARGLSETLSYEWEFRLGSPLRARRVSEATTEAKFHE